MGKYDPLQTHLRRQKAAVYEMSFRDIEGVIHALLPKSAAQPQWWSEGNDAAAAPVQCRAWLTAGYSACLVKGADRVVFARQPR